MRRAAFSELTLHTVEAPARHDGFALRLLAYLLVIAGVFELVALAMGRWGWEAVLREDGLIEWGEVGVLALAGVLAVGLVWRAPRTSGVYGVLAVGLWLVVFREFDNSAAYRVLSSPVKIAIVVVLVGGVVFLDRRAIVSSVLELLARPQGILFLLGSVLVFVWAQLLGQPAFWIPLYRIPDAGGGWWRSRSSSRAIS